VTATPTPLPINPVFAKDQYFEIIEGSRAQVMYDNKNSVMIYYFDSNDQNSANQLAAIKDSARRLTTEYSKIVVYGIDVRTSPKLERLTWIDRFIARGSVSYPVLFLLFSNGSVQVVTDFGTQSQIDSLVENWNRGYYNTPTPSATPTPVRTGSPTPTPTPTGISLSNIHFRYMSEYDATNWFNRGESFAYLYFDSSREYSATDMQIISEAVAKAEFDIYYSDHRDQPKDVTWFANNLYVVSTIPNPCIFFVSRGGIVDDAYNFYSVDSLVTDLKRFFTTYY
jgi:hypothetical protein